MTDDDINNVSNVAFGGEGVIHTRKGVVFVYDTLPSESVSIKITQQKKRFSRGELVSIEHSHPLRINPACSHFSICGGCQLQHAHYSLQAELKRQWLKESLERIGGVTGIEVPPIQPAGRIWGYRRHITLHLKVESGKYRAFFHGRDPKISVPPGSCPLFSSASFKVLHEVVEKLRVDASKNEEGRVQLMKVKEDKWLYTFHFKKAPKGAWEILKTLMDKDGYCAGVKLKTAGKTHSVGLEEGKIHVAGLSFAYSPEAFIQTHPDQSEAIYRKIVEHVKSGRVLDLYGGIGVTACLVAREGAHVTSVELNAAAVKLAKRNFAENGLRGGDFWCGDVLQYLKEHDWGGVDIIIANPPREGIAADALKLIAESGKKLLLISCMPTTLARDVKLLAQAGYRLEWVQGYDMFPQTTHFETVAYLTL